MSSYLEPAEGGGEEITRGEFIRGTQSKSHRERALLVKEKQQQQNYYIHTTSCSRFLLGYLS